MISITVKDATAAQLATVADGAELCDESGQFIGWFVAPKPSTSRELLDAARGFRPAFQFSLQQLLLVMTIAAVAAAAAVNSEKYFLAMLIGGFLVASGMAYAIYRVLATVEMKSTQQYAQALLGHAFVGAVAGAIIGGGVALVAEAFHFIGAREIVWNTTAAFAVYSGSMATALCMRRQRRLAANLGFAN
ncbi:MAG: hypothetical protein CMJ58_08585 [Planctomycetaceae bacterium]|nr:hypothetical protein [Planctomycetaceae bacterium]